MTMQGKPCLLHVQQEFADYLKCGRLEHGFLRVQCNECHHEHLVVFSCKRRGFCPSCGARRMAESAALQVDEVIPEQPIRQWVLSFAFQLRFIRRFAPHPSGQLKLFNASLLSVHQPPATDGAGTGDRVPGHIIPSDSEGRIHFKTPYRDGATHVIFEPGDQRTQYITLLRLSIVSPEFLNLFTPLLDVD
jgi:ribosomal protein S27E